MRCSLERGHHIEHHPPNQAKSTYSLLQKKTNKKTQVPPELNYDNYLVTQFGINLVVMSCVCLACRVGWSYCNGPHLRESAVVFIKSSADGHYSETGSVTHTQPLTKLMRWVATEQSGFLIAMLCGVPMCLAASPKPKASIHGPVWDN